MKKIFLRLCLTAFTLIFLTGCKATYPKERLADSIVELCRNEYKIEVKSKIAGKTLAIFLPLPSLFDVTFRINEKAQDMIQDVILSASRAVLSTDAPIEFYCVIAQDVKFPEIQIIVVKYVDDVKRAFFADISRGEYFKRTIFDININPQSKKEKPVKEIFEKYNLEPEWENKIIEEFFRSKPMELEDFGYWDGQFYIKDITLPEFLAAQMSYRIKTRFRDNKELSKKLLVKAIDGSYKTPGKSKFFTIYFDIQLHEILKVHGETFDEKIIFENILKEVADCIYGYKFTDFDSVRIFNKNKVMSRVFIPKSDIYAFKKGKLGIDVILGGM